MNCARPNTMMNPSGTATIQSAKRIQRGGTGSRGRDGRGGRLGAAIGGGATGATGATGGSAADVADRTLVVVEAPLPTWGHGRSGSAPGGAPTAAGLGTCCGT